MKQNSVALKTMAMKSRLANVIRKELNGFVPKGTKWNPYKKKELTEEDKLRIFDLLWQEYLEMDTSLRNYKAKRQWKAEIQRLREEKQKINLVVSE